MGLQENHRLIDANFTQGPLFTQPSTVFMENLTAPENNAPSASTRLASAEDFPSRRQSTDSRYLSDSAEISDQRWSVSGDRMLDKSERFLNEKLPPSNRLCRREKMTAQGRKGLSLPATSALDWSECK